MEVCAIAGGVSAPARLADAGNLFGLLNNFPDCCLDPVRRHRCRDPRDDTPLLVKLAVAVILLAIVRSSRSF